MTLDQLETFVQVARARSFSRAGVVLDLAQPTLSGRIAALETELGGQLFHRRGHTLDLTELGRGLLPYAERMLALRTEGLREVRRLREGGLGRLALGANPTCSHHLAPRLVESYLRAHPSAPVWVRTAQSPALMESLMDGVIHLALCSRALLHPNAEVLWTYRDPLLLVAGKGHPLARRGECTRADLAKHTLLSTQAGPTHIGLRHILAGEPGRPEARIAVEATAGEVLNSLLLHGVGVTILPALAVWEELARGDVVSVALLDAELPVYEVALARWPGRAPTTADEAFADLVHEVRVPALLDGHV